MHVMVTKASMGYDTQHNNRDLDLQTVCMNTKRENGNKNSVAPRQGVKSEAVS